jgi:hypothetical protein
VPPASPPFYDWRYFVALSGAPAAVWIEGYRQPDVAALVEDLERALSLLRRRQYAHASQLLAAVPSRMDALRDVCPSMLHVLGRHYHGVQAYGCYCVEDFDRARQELLLAEEAVRGAIEIDRYLLPLASDCHEFHLHHARLARNQRKWSEMREQIALVRGMVTDQVPLCRLRDGSPVRYSTIRVYYDPRTPIPEDAQRAARPFLDTELRCRLFEQFVTELYSIPGMVIPYV